MWHVNGNTKLGLIYCVKKAKNTRKIVHKKLFAISMIHMEWNGTLFSAHLMHDKASSDDESSSWIRDNNGNKKQQKVIKCIARERKTERMAGSVCVI